MHASNVPSVRCPECGAEIALRSPSAILVVCSYCRAAVYWNQQTVLSAGRQSALIEGFTRLYLGATGSVRGERMEVLGRARYRHASGLWDEWFVALGPHRSGWITEDDHELAIQHALEGLDLSSSAQLSPGQPLTVQGILFEVDEIGETECVGIEGALPKHVLTGQRYRYLDASSVDGRYALGLELDRHPPTVFLGQWLAHDDVRLDDEGDAW